MANVILFHEFENEIHFSIAGVEMIFNHGMSVIDVSVVSVACVIHIKVNNIEIIARNLFISVMIMC